MQKYIDSHCHFFCPSIDKDVGAICNATNPTEWMLIAELVDKSKSLYGAVGVHPWFISGLMSDWQDELYSLLIKNPDLMVGEIGLDKYHDDLSGQINVFIAQLNTAYNLNRGICVHCVGMWHQLLQILKQNKNVLPRFVLAHCYSGPVKDIKKMAENYNMYFSYGFRNLQNSACVLSTPLNRILAETDSDTPSDVIRVVNRIAEILNIAPDKMADIIYENTIRMLKL